MRLADYLLAARGTIPDMGGFATSMGPVIAKAQRFEISDDVARAAGELLQSRPSTLAAALPLCRLPYETMWLEWKGGLGTENHRGEDAAPTPHRQGMLIETPPFPGLQGQVGHMTAAWVHTHYPELPAAVNTSPIAVYFDWRADGDVREVIRLSHQSILESWEGYPWHPVLKIYVDLLTEHWCKISSPEAVSHFFTGMDKWRKFATSPAEIEAIRFLDHHMLPGLSPHGVGLASIILVKASAAELRHFMTNWQADIQGEGSFVECFLAMLNSKTPCVEHEAADLSRLNKARRKSGKPEFLPYTKTRLAMSRSQARIAQARGLSREAARQHMVRGHFKIRRSGVYWWSSFLRGDASRGTVERQEYDVVNE